MEPRIAPRFDFVLPDTHKTTLAFDGSFIAMTSERWRFPLSYSRRRRLSSLVFNIRRPPLRG